MGFKAFIDAQVLVEARPRDILLTLAEAGVFDPLWSPLVLEEMLRHLPDSMTQAQSDYLVQKMNEAFPEASVDWSGVTEPQVRVAVNAKDRHVAQAALLGNADVLVTEDGPFFDELVQSRLIDAQKLPEFIAYAIDVDQPRARQALLDMAVRRWGAADEHDAEVRLKAYFEKRGWDPTLLDAGRRSHR